MVKRKSLIENQFRLKKINFRVNDFYLLKEIYQKRYFPLTLSKMININSNSFNFMEDERSELELLFLFNTNNF
jgi:hypothetical protein